MNIDKIGIASSLLCLVHCLAVPVVSTLIYEGTLASGSHSHGSLLSTAVDITFLIIAVYAVVASVRKVNTVLPKILLIGGLVVFGGGIIARYELGSDIFVHLGSATLIAGHLVAFLKASNSKPDLKQI
jgi:hypothetical protein